MSSPGAGKTSLLEKTILGLKGELRIGVVEGDIQSTYDAERIGQTGAPAVQIKTGGACHLDSNMVQEALKSLDLSGLDLLFIENVGNLVCPASFDLGESLRFVLLSSPEGDDKPKKYPEAFLTSHVLVLTKSDLIPRLPFDAARARREALEINPRLDVFAVSALTGEGMDAVEAFLVGELEKLRSAHA